MNDARRKKLLDAIELLKDRQQQLHNISTEAWEKQDRLPETEEFYSLRNHLSDASEALDEAEAILEGLIEDTEKVLTEQAAPKQSSSSNNEFTEEERAKEIEADKLPEKQLSRVAIWWRMFVLLLVFLPLVFFLLYLWLIHDDGAYLGLAAILFIVAVVLLAVLMNKWAKIPDGEELQGTYDSRPGIHPTTEIMAGMMGAEMLHRAAERERQEAEKQRYESLYWQESIRDKNPRHDFDYDHEDDWLGTD